MHPLIAVLLVTTAACAVARPPTYWTPAPRHHNDVPPTPLSSSVMIEKLRPPPMEDVIPRYFAFEEKPRYLHTLRQQYADPKVDWLTREINRLSDDINYEEGIEQDRFNPLFKRSDEVVDLSPLIASTDTYEDQISQSVSQLTTPMPKTTAVSVFVIPPSKKKKNPKKRSEEKISFALTPLDTAYYDNQQAIAIVKTKPEKIEHVYKKPLRLIEGQRRIRQNPNLGKTRNLVSDDLEEFKALMENGNPPKVIEGIQGEGVNASSVADPARALYGVAMMAAIGTASAFGLLAFIFGWLTLSRRAKAAADVDYPAYGVTGPSLDPSGDRKLAQSAHMYHYQHQKQQILAMERSAADISRSVSDPESEEENEEGDYTVYECPGFATTGDMVVKNPLFSDEPTPATPGKCELVKPQPKE